jgi:hypothetical protein
MKRSVFCIILIFSIIILNAEENSYIIKSEIRPDTNDQGIMLINQTVRFNSPIEILNSGWVDLYGDNQYTEFFAVYSQYDGRAIGTILSSLRQNKTTFSPKCLYISFPMTQLNLGNEIIELDLNGNDRYGFDFFRHNNNNYVIMYYKHEEDVFLYFTIYEFLSNPGVIIKIYRDENDSYDRYEIVDGDLFFYIEDSKFILKIENEKIYFIPYE